MAPRPPPTAAPSASEAPPAPPPPPAVASSASVPVPPPGRPAQGPASVPASCPARTARFDGGTVAMQGGRVMVEVKPFCMDLTEVPVEAYSVCVETGRCSTDHVTEESKDGVSFKPDARCNYGRRDRAQHPMNCVDWAQSAAYCAAQGERLPSEEEWEWAARGGAERRAYPWGSDEPGSRVCWSGVAQRNGTCPVGANPAGDAPGGVHDLMGNVWEWTETPLSIFLPGSGPRHESDRIARGGGWGTRLPSHLTSTVRNWRPPAERVNSLGFRCVMPLGDGAAAPALSDLAPGEADRLRALRQGIDATARETAVPRRRWTPSDPARWRGALEGYVPAVRVGDQIALGSAASSFARYLNGMHNRIHPLFSEAFLGSLAGATATAPAKGPSPFTRLEIVLTADGQITQMGVVRTSGLDEFDRGALDAVDRAAPFGAAPTDIVSDGGRVYVHWDFHRDERSGCSTVYARPFLLVKASAP